ncbi:MAG: hypothetical protein RL456_2742 [Pseudomonadota bacterium]|jgi:hypothetical protein
MAISLASIQKGGSRKPPIVGLHGGPGIGKTTFAASASAPIFIRTEDGMGTLTCDAFPVAQTWQDVIDALSALFANPGHGYQTVVVDSLSALEPLVWQRVAADAQKPSIEDLGYGKGYIMALEYWQKFLAGIIALRDQQGIMPILIAHSEITRHDSPEVEPYDRYTIRLHKRASALIYERADVIGFANWQTTTFRDKDVTAFTSKKDAPKVLNVRGIGTGERLLHLVERPAYVAKNRYAMPETIPLSWDAFQASLAAAYPPAPAQPQPKTK